MNSAYASSRSTPLTAEKPATAMFNRESAFILLWSHAMTSLTRPLLSLLVTLCLVPSGVFAQTRISELPGVKDHSLVSRFAGSVLQNAADERFASVRVPAGPGRMADSGLAFARATTVEGHVSAFFYVAPKERSALE